MREDGWLQRLLYLIMTVLAAYIIYKGMILLAKTDGMQRVLDEGTVQRTLEDAAMRTCAPGYTASVEEVKEGDWLADWMKQIVPAYSYLAEGEGTAESETDTVQAETTGFSATVEESETDGRVETAQAETTGFSATVEESETDGRVETAQADTAGFSETTIESEAERSEETAQAVEAAASGIPDALLAQLEDYNYLVSNYYTVDGGTVADDQLLDADVLLGEELSIEKNPEVPQILIYHTHSQEAFADSREGVTEDTVVGMGETLAGLLRSEYGYNVIHDTGVYDLVDGVLDRSAAYDYARESVEQILAENPTVEVVIDLHRDGVEGQKFVTEIDGRPTSMIMFFNGISRNSLDEPLYWLENPYIMQNLAFSLQLELKAREQYPGFTRNIYLKAERFNLHLRPRSLLIEAGTQLNTVEEERNAMIPLAELLNQVLEE